MYKKIPDNGTTISRDRLYDDTPQKNT